MINIGKEWRWMDDKEEVIESEWDYYSGLPNPMWYENKDKEDHI